MIFGLFAGGPEDWPTTLQQVAAKPVAPQDAASAAALQRRLD
jgi:hypothetical protein